MDASDTHAGTGPERGRAAVLRPLALIVAGLAPVFVIMTSERRFEFSVPVGFLGCLAATWGIFDALDVHEGEAEARPAVSARRLAPTLIEALASTVVLVALLRLAVAGVLPRHAVTAGIGVTASFLWCVTAWFRCLELLRTGSVSASAFGPVLRRPGFWLIALTSLLYLPTLGSFSLSDPWETHYGEVAREMLARDDWVSLWWAQDGWFFSKPILDFWLQGLSFSLLGVHYLPDQMLAAAASGAVPQPEWAARFPVFLLTLVGGYVLYKSVAEILGKLPGFISGLALVTVPYWYLLAHQTMTDMPYVAPLAAGMGLLLLGFHTDPERPRASYAVALRGRTLRLSAHHLVFGSVAMLVLPQALYLLSRHVTLHFEPFGFGLPHADGFFSGSGAGNCGLPGNEPCRRAVPVHAELQPGLMALVWLAGLGALLWTTRNERRLQRLYFVGAWLCFALSAMAKGAPGLVLPVFVTGIYAFATRRWRDLTRLELGTGVALMALIILPWYVQMYARHGSPFIDRLLLHDMYKRAFVHVHDTNTGDDTSFRYYVWQLGYGLFPWTGLAAAGLLAWFSKRSEAEAKQQDVKSFFGLWFISAFALFTISLTKFHHYIFPAVPAVAVLAGLFVARAVPASTLPGGRRLAAYLGLLGLGALGLVGGIVAGLPGDWLGRATAEGHVPPGAPLLGGVLLAAGAGALLVAHRVAGPERRHPERRHPEPFDATALTLPVLGLAAAIAVLLAGRDLFATTKGDIEGQARLMHLFTYNYARPWPKSLDFTAVLVAFTAVSSLACAALAWPRLRRHAALLLCAGAVLWAAWGVNVYLVRCAPHWGQRETVLAYYRDRAGPEQPLVAYQMNWKGENFYTGNRVPAFVSTGTKFKQWLTEQKDRGVKVVYFTTEHSRLGSLKNELGDVEEFQLLTTKELNNKFFLARVKL